MGPIGKIILATASFAALHSALASRPAKKAASRLFGEENRNAYYRLFFNLQGTATFGGLAWYILRQPDRHQPLWRMNKPMTALTQLLRGVCLVGFFQAARQIGLARVSGLHSLHAHLSGNQPVPPEPEAQGPAFDRPLSGPFRWTRHPLNFLALPLIWLAPRMSRNRFIFNSAATLYFILGSIHEEHRLRHAWDDAYRQYQSQTRFFLGQKSHPPFQLPSQETELSITPAPQPSNFQI